MKDTDPLVMYAAIYTDGRAALDALDAVEQLHEDGLVGDYDAAVIDNTDGEAHILQRMDRPRHRLIPEVMGVGNLPRKELYEVAGRLEGDQAALIVVGEPTVAEGLEKALVDAVTTARNAVDAAADELTADAKEAFRS